MSGDVLIVICVIYAMILFSIAYYADRVARRDEPAGWLRSPLVYTLSLSVYCTAWTFYGAVGSAARSGMEFLAIYIGPSLVFFGFWVVLRRMVRIGHTQNITSIADFLSSRYGKSNTIAVLVTVLCVIAITPYISLQLQSISQSFAAFFPGLGGDQNTRGVAFGSTLVLTLFVVLFGTRHASAKERHHGVVMAIAVESLVKLFAILVVGSFAVWSFGGWGNVFADEKAQELLREPIFTTRWFALVTLSFMAVLVLPRMFQVIVIENADEDHLFTASWAFPLYLLVLNIFVFPIAIVGMNYLGANANPDYFLITLPLQEGQTALAYLAFIGGLSASTSMIIVTTIAIATMVSNHIVTPIWLDARGNQQNPNDVGRALLRIRRVAIGLILLLGFAYFEISGGRSSLASIGLIAFAGVAQLFPSLFAALFWRGATRFGAILSITVGSIVWLYTLFLPSMGSAYVSLPIEWLAPNALLGVNIGDPVVHSLFWSMSLNVVALFLGSIFSTPRPVERLQANQFVDIFNPSRASSRFRRESDIRVEDYLVLSQRVLGESTTRSLFRNIAEAQGRSGELPIVNDFFFERLELALGGVVGGAAAHALISQLAGSASVAISETIKLADETIQNIEYARALELQSRELQDTAQALREANASLVALDAQKDAFLSQVSHELRTPMSAIRSFTEILRDEALPPDEREKMLGIIAEENKRLTDLLDDILDLSYLESGQVRLAKEPHDLRDILERSLHTTKPIWEEAGLRIKRRWDEKEMVTLCDFNRVSQIFINLITNAAKYVTGDAPELLVRIGESGKYWLVEFLDNGPGVQGDARDAVFEKFARGGENERAGSAGLGLAISREIAENLGGKLELIPSVGGARFRVSLLKLGVEPSE